MSDLMKYDGFDACEIDIPIENFKPLAEISSYFYIPNKKLFKIKPKKRFQKIRYLVKDVDGYYGWFNI